MWLIAAGCRLARRLTFLGIGEGVANAMQSYIAGFLASMARTGDAYYREETLRLGALSGVFSFFDRRLSRAIILIAEGCFTQ